MITRSGALQRIKAATWPRARRYFTATPRVMVTQIAWERAGRGLAWLKETGPRYGLDYRHINPFTVNVASNRFCPLGQVSGDGATMKRLPPELWFGSGGGYGNPDWLTDHGFDIRAGDPEDMYFHLSEAWRVLLIQDQRAMHLQKHGEPS